MQQVNLLVLTIVLLTISTRASHYRGGSFSWTIQDASNNSITNQTNVPARITQRHSWRRSFGKNHFCDKNTIASSGLIGKGELISSISTQNTILAKGQCTDFNEQFDYSSGEISTLVTVPMRNIIEYAYAYQGCCWIALLPPETGSGKLNNSPIPAMNPIVELQIGKVHLIQIPMADSDGDRLRCR
ncbi:unnamed protein product [Rotaria magnacalcarata]|uniref:Uncharacterized protein n=1 Tax=Rotaria magnacalcarata TaxID=392030 RepID=A0A814LMF5_9BILA|nr:unnamed protein product [Rotaria magnacalcarata]CAF3796618.1 unnamed protein product [Rotaria magnacalcarata]CAF3923869.1 unnamed protein product [Rotaria magnacalcarata]